MKAKAWTKIKGQWYKPGENLPNLEEKEPERNSKGSKGEENKEFSKSPADLKVNEAIELVSKTEDQEIISKWLEKERGNNKPRKTVITALENKLTGE
ncbi:hypothetical protein [Orenia marismortui]|uniref:Uncharacterized protein n=1 Tax=Orenia marismortui TaxID=46469 RepID=A0A4V3GWJ6_9FIRM|nr:hypothetical protein [Orenia marismortui]TDX44319.1 hypothetical protein C7959_1576 [Orenia marismortui]